MAMEPIELGEIAPGHTEVERKLAEDVELNLSFSLPIEQTVSISTYKRRSNYTLTLTPVGGASTRLRSNSYGRVNLEQILPAGPYLLRAKWASSTSGDVKATLISKPAPFAAAATMRAASTGVTANAVAGGNWSDTNVWQDGIVPSEGDSVRIAANVDVTMDVSPPGLGPVSILGGLHFAPADLALHAHSIVIAGGELGIGTAETS
jgi:hypothetical protein